MWMNQGVGANNADNFDIFGESNREIARAIVRRAVIDWNAVIADQNVDRNNDPNTNNNFELTLNAAFLDAGETKGETKGGNKGAGTKSRTGSLRF
jgi:hypothetical protein